MKSFYPIPLAHCLRNLIIQLKRLETSGDLDYTKNALFTTTDTVVKEGNTDMVEKEVKQNLMW